MNTQALHTFVEAFQSCYKDGTNGTRDCRYFAGLYFILRIVAAAIYVQLNVGNIVREFVLLYGFTALLFALVQPYKERMYNVIDAVMFGQLGTGFFLYLWTMEYFAVRGHNSAPLLVLIDVLYSLPLLYLVLFIVYWVLDRQTSCIQKLRRHRLLRCLLHKREERQRVHFDAALPHRLQVEYEQL